MTEMPRLAHRRQVSREGSSLRKMFSRSSETTSYASLQVFWFPETQIKFQNDEDPLLTIKRK